MQLEDGENPRSLRLTTPNHSHGIGTGAKLRLLAINVIAAIPHKQLRIAVLALETLPVTSQSGQNPDLHPLGSRRSVLCHKPTDVVNAEKARIPRARSLHRKQRLKRSHGVAEALLRGRLRSQYDDECN